MFCSRFIKSVSNLSFKRISYCVCLLIPFMLLPFALNTGKEAKCAYVILWMAIYWMFEPIHLAATALLPVVLLPMLGILNSQQVCANYMKEIFMVIIGGMIVAIAIEDSFLHERIALKVILIIGTEIKWLMMGFMLTTTFLSMWINKVSATVMMIPVVEAVVEKMTFTSSKEEGDISLRDIDDDTFHKEKEVDVEKDSGDSRSISPRKLKRNSALKTCMLLCVCYSANLGGTGSITSGLPNLVLKNMLEEIYPDSDEITFTSWMMYNVPGMILCVLIGWFYLYFGYIRRSTVENTVERKESVREMIIKRYENLGPWNFQQIASVVLLATLVFLWTFRDPKFMTGWATSINSDIKIGASVPAIAVGFLLFILPSNPRNFSSSPPLLEWKAVQGKLPWGVIIFLGGGLALADATQKSGLSLLIGNKLSSLSVLPPEAVVVVLCLTTTMMTEVFSNTLTASILLPVLSQMAVSMKVNPLFLMLPITLTCSYAFMLPVACATNAIVFEYGKMRIVDMAKPGLVMNFVCCAVQLVMINTLGAYMFNLRTFPHWANNSASFQDHEFPHVGSDVLMDSAINMFSNNTHQI